MSFQFDLFLSSQQARQNLIPELVLYHTKKSGFGQFSVQWKFRQKNCKMKFFLLPHTIEISNSLVNKITKLRSSFEQVWAQLVLPQYSL